VSKGLVRTCAQMRGHVVSGFSRTVTWISAVEESGDLFDRDAAVFGVLADFSGLPSIQSQQAGSIRCHIVEPFGARSSIRSTHDEHVDASTLV
jgi:hypothetical protein